ncbi:MAG: hypothetical protein C5B59_08400 [Bacteroidetes bacterium]|nr:MAG: hypothetical protein C5B59_08400 [Bacteroidota bacterium]
MKKLLLLIAIAGFTFGCNNSGSQSNSTDTSAASRPATTDTSSAAAKPALKDGLMTLRGGKMMVVRNNAWVALDSAVTCSNGRKVTVDGQVSKGNKTRKLEEGMMIDKDGQITDKDGKPVDTTGWD